MKAPNLKILAVTASRSDARFAARVLDEHGDSVEIANDVPDALTRMAHEHFDVAVVSLSLPRGDGLALVHHIRALYPNLDVIVAAAPTEIEETAHAMALGVLCSVMLPFTGDALLVAVDRARERRLLIAERSRLSAEEATSRRRSATYARCATFVSETELNTVAARVLDACLAEVEATTGAIYVPDPLGSSRYLRVAELGQEQGLAVQLDADEMAAIDPSRVVHPDHDRLRIVLMGDRDLAAVVDIRCNGNVAVAEGRHEALEVVAGLGTAAFAAARKVEGIARAGIKDPETSAYTFAYFGDVAGREIDRAARHGRRFALMTLSLSGVEELRAQLAPAAMTTIRRAVADAVLESIRDSDVLARVEDDEFYLLLPETGLLGALGCRRRIVQRIAALEDLRRVVPDIDLEPVVGIAVYPSDGSDLGRLLRASRRRSDRARNGVWRKLCLSGMPFWDAIGRLLGNESDAGLRPDGTIALHPDLLEANDEGALARHVAVPQSFLSQIGSAITNDAVRHRVPGTVYVAGDAMLASAVARAIEAAETPRVRVWVLGDAAAGEVVERIRLSVDDPRLRDRVLILALTELGGYALAARKLTQTTMLAYHAGDLDLVDGLVTSLQRAYHLQPEVR